MSSGQFFVFLSCVTFGILTGIIYSIINFIKMAIKINIIKIILDVLYFSLLGILFVIYSFKCQFPSVRVYMAVGVFLGVYFYAKSFHFILAKIGKRLYNKIVSIKKQKRNAVNEQRNTTKNKRKKV